MIVGGLLCRCLGFSRIRLAVVEALELAARPSVLRHHLHGRQGLVVRVAQRDVPHGRQVRRRLARLASEAVHHGDAVGVIHAHVRLVHGRSDGRQRIVYHRGLRVGHHDDGGHHHEAQKAERQVLGGAATRGAGGSRARLLPLRAGGGRDQRLELDGGRAQRQRRRSFAARLWRAGARRLHRRRRGVLGGLRAGGGAAAAAAGISGVRGLRGAEDLRKLRGDLVLRHDAL
mmetsp:Transcript_44585/g.139833  ORF Transcript_44585/g.139833 Transcript_44585/m.139833 type:complete len:230 (+) Transcript_44585:1009-1698(+)